MFKKAFQIIVLALLILGVCTASSARVGTLVRTTGGLLEGQNLGEVDSFLGIPYAEAPVGDLRWQPPQEKTPWEGILKADSFGPACPQDPLYAEYLNLGNQSEDCLYLNIWAPAGAKDLSDLPVMVWLYGGGFQFGSASQPDYDGAALAANGAVVVTLNYRVGSLGYLVHPDMAAEQEHSGNYGMLDQLAALKWVKENIEAFGGSSEKVTIFGQSAGGASVWLNLFSPLGQGLFDRAICESGTGPGTYYATHGLTGSWEQAAYLGQIVADSLGASSLAELRALPAQDIVNATSRLGLAFAPVVDGYYLPDDFRNLVGSANDVPVIVGSTKDDALGWSDPPTSVAAYNSYLEHTFGGNAAAVEAAYPAASPEDAWALYDFVDTTAGFTEPARFTARATQAQGLDTYRYVFEYAPQTERGQMWGVHHDVELPYLFGNLDPTQGYGSYDFALSDQLTSYWLNFADTGDPNGAGLTNWPTYGGQENILFIGDAITTGTGYFNSDCDFFEAIAPRATVDYPGS